MREPSRQRPAHQRPPPSVPVWLWVMAWVVPGLGHLWLGRRRTGAILLVALPLFFAIGVALDGQIFPFDVTSPLVALAAAADLGIGLPYFLVWGLGLGTGEVRAVTYEYGNVYMIVAGLLNALVVIDAHDIAIGRK